MIFADRSFMNKALWLLLLFPALSVLHTDTLLTELAQRADGLIELMKKESDDK